jgi:dethiobiotin synthetase
VCPYRLPDPLAPSLAAERAGLRIDVEALVAHAQRRAAMVDLLLIEGAGGLLVPLTLDTSFADFARRLAAPVLVVVGSRLGAINHALLTFDALAARGIPIVGFVVNRLGADDDLAVATNEPLLAELTSVPCLGVTHGHATPPSCAPSSRAGGAATARARAPASVALGAHARPRPPDVLKRLGARA